MADLRGAECLAVGGAESRWGHVVIQSVVQKLLECVLRTAWSSSSMTLLVGKVT